MPFEPRLFADDDRREPLADGARLDGEHCPICGAIVSAQEASGTTLAGGEALALPADLLALANQLGDDADHLESRYPAAELTERPRKPPAWQSPSGRWIRWSAAAAVMMVIATWPSVGERLAEFQRQRSNSAADKEALAGLDRSVSHVRVEGLHLNEPSERNVATGSVAEPVSVGSEQPSAPRRPPADEVEMLRIQVSGFQKVIERLQDELAARDKSQAEMVKLIRSLQDEVSTLKGQGTATKAAGTKDKD